MSQTPTELLPTAVTPPPDLVPGYEFQGVIGSGGFGTVFKATQLRLGRAVAVKVARPDLNLTPTLAARFEAEAITLARLHHPNIVAVYDHGRHGGRMFLAMELLEGEDLGQRLLRSGRLPERVAWGIARQAAAALDHAAGQGVVHRDVKPSNLYLVPAPTGLALPPDLPLVKVTDFGLARTRPAEVPADARLTVSGAIAGTPAYMAPEQFRHAADVDHRADIYALGATVYHAVTGRPPFTGETVWDLMARKVEHSVRFDPGLSRPTVQLLKEMLAPDPNRRVPSYEELIARIDRLADADASPARTRRDWLWAGGLALAAGAIVAGVGAVRGWPGGPPDASTRQVSFEPTGDHVYLFDGQSINGWFPSTAGGQWGMDRDLEKVRVMAGTGIIRRTFAPLDDYAVTVGLDLHQAAAAEVHFAIPAGRPDAPRLVLRITKAAGAVLGTRAGDNGEFVPGDGAVPFPPAAWFEGRRPYLEVKVGRAGGRWRAWFHGREVGSAADDGPAKSPEVRLAAEGGPARVDTVLLTPLRPADGPPEN